MANMKDEYVNVVRIAMNALDEASTTNQTTAEQWRIFKNALEKISPCEKDRYYKGRGGKFTGDGTLDNITSDHAHAGDFEEITKEEFETEED